jgi:exopolysaccharide biosynthesis polyprenyl glycosylphosphotransferase
MNQGRQFTLQKLLLAFLADSAAVVATFFLVMSARATMHAWWAFDLIPGESNTLGSFKPQDHHHLILFVVPIWLIALLTSGAYGDPRIVRPNRLVLRISMGVVGAFLSFLGLLWSLKQGDAYNRTFLLGFGIATLPALVLSHYLSAIWFRHGRVRARDARRVLLVGEVEEVRRFVDLVAANPDWALLIVGILLPSQDDAKQAPLDDEARELESITRVPVVGGLADLRERIGALNIHHVFLFGRTWSTETLRYVADTCEVVGVGFSLDANFLGLKFGRANLLDYGGRGMLCFHMVPSDPYALMLKRLLDIVGSAGALVVLAPLFLVVALLIKIEDGGPILFAQVRSGLYGTPFHMLKFRSMVVGAEARQKELQVLNEVDGPVFKIRRDPRITRIGAFIRRTSIDEFPQFLNVLLGEMSLVGPRPPIPAEVEKYERWQRRRLSMRPGLTCIWQVYARNRVDFETWMKLDLKYIDNWSLLLDIELILKTVPAMLFGTGR